MQPITFTSVAPAAAARRLGLAGRAQPWWRAAADGERHLAIIRAVFVVFACTLPFEALNLGQWSRIDTFEGESSFVSLPKIAGYAFFLVTLLDPRRCYARIPAALYCFGAYLAFYTVAGLLGEYPGVVLSRSVRTLQMLVLLYAGCNLLADARTRAAVVLALALSCTAFCLLEFSGVLGQAMIQTTADGEMERVTGLAEDANTVADILALGLLSVMALATGGIRAPRGVAACAWLAAPALTLAIVRTGSRGGMLALGAGLLAFIVGERTPGKMLRNLLLAAVAAACLAVCLLNWESALKRWEATIYDGNVAGRDQIVDVTWKMIQERPAFGWGPVTSEHVLGAAFGKAVRGTHNLWLALLSEVGCVGALPYVGGVLLCLRAAWRGRGGPAGGLPLTLMVTVMAANLSVVWDNRKLYWLVLALSLASDAGRARRRPERVARGHGRTGRARRAAAA